MTSKESPEEVAHESAHMKGIPQERLAQFVGTASLITSDNPSLQYLGYRSWINMLRAEIKMPLTDDNDKTDNLRSRGLNETTIKEFQDQEGYFSNIYSQKMSYSALFDKTTTFLLKMMPKKLSSKIPEKLIEISKNPEQNLENVFRLLILKFTGQKNITHAYSHAPLGLLSSYRLNKLNT
jgi:hypothetical protein